MSGPDMRFEYTYAVPTLAEKHSGENSHVLNVVGESRAALFIAIYQWFEHNGLPTPPLPNEDIGWVQEGARELMRAQGLVHSVMLPDMQVVRALSVDTARMYVETQKAIHLTDVGEKP